MLLELKQLHADPRNSNVCPPDVLEKIERNIQRSGQCPPLIVRPHPQKADEYVLIDGHHRLKILQALQWESVECQVWSIDEKEAALALVTLNRLRGVDDVFLRSALLQELSSHFSLDDLALWVPESSAQIQDLLDLLTLDKEALEEVCRKQTELEKETLPVPLTFMLNAEDARLVEDALALFLTPETGKSDALVAVCRQALDKRQPTFTESVPA